MNKTYGSSLIFTYYDVTTTGYWDFILLRLLQRDAIPVPVFKSACIGAFSLCSVLHQFPSTKLKCKHRLHYLHKKVLWYKTSKKTFAVNNAPILSKNVTVASRERINMDQSIKFSNVLNFARNAILTYSYL